MSIILLLVVLLVILDGGIVYRKNAGGGVGSIPAGSGFALMFVVGLVLFLLGCF